MWQVYSVFSQIIDLSPEKCQVALSCILKVHFYNKKLYPDSWLSFTFLQNVKSYKNFQEVFTAN